MQETALANYVIKLPDHCEVIDVNPGAGIAAVTKVAEEE
jgi:hypothetical protein